VGGIVAGIVSNLVLTVLRMVVLLGWYLAMLLIWGPWRPDIARDSLSELWVPLKLLAFPFVGERSLDGGFDGPVVFLGIVTRLVFAICSGALFGLIAHRLSRMETVVLGIVFGFVCWAVSSHVITPPLGQSYARLIEFIPYGLTLSVTFLWYEGRCSLPRG
jgi:hypothetical protein